MIKTIIGNIDLIKLLLTIIVVGFFVNIIYKYIFVLILKYKRKVQTKNLKFVQVKIPQKSVSKQSDIDANDHTQSMKQNIEIMNQVYKNFYALYEEGILKSKYRQEYISMEIFIEKEIIKFILGVPEDFVENIEKIITSFYPGSSVEPIKQPKMLDAGKFMAGGEFLLKKGNEYPLKTYEGFEADPMDSILSAYSRVLSNEKLCFQILVSPLDESRLKKLRQKTEKIKKGKNGYRIIGLIKNIRKGIFGQEDKKEENNEEKIKHDFSQQQLGDLDKKLEDELFSIKISVLASSPDSHRPQRLIDDLTRGLNQYNYIGLNGLKYEYNRNINQFAKEFIKRKFFSQKGLGTYKHNTNLTILNIKELSSILHFPHSRFNKSPRISRQKYKVIAAPDNVPDDGMLIGSNTYGGIKKEIRLTDLDRFRHVYIVGQTGTGKTTLMLLQAINDMNSGNGFCYIDPHGDACEDLLSRFPKNRIDDLIYFDLSNTEYPIGFNPLSADGEDERDIITNDLVEMFVNLYGPEIFGPRIQDYFRNACFLLMEQPEGGTLIDIMRLFTDDAFAESKIRNVKNPVIAAWWNKTYKKMGDREKAEAIPFMQAKFGPFTTGVYIRNIIGQPKPGFNLYNAMQQKKIILCNLSKGLAGEENSKLIGKMLVMQIKIAALKRAKIEIGDRVPFFLYIDEFQNYVSKSIESVLSEARKYRLGLTVAHQYIEQLKQSGLSGNIDLSTAIFGNVGTIFALKVGAPDAEFLEKEFSPEFTQSDLINMDKHKGIMKMSIDNQQSRPFSFKPYYRGDSPQLNTKEKIEIIKQISSLKRGSKRELVDKEIYFRVGV